jgi:ribosomal protein S18 acetylase RimI-like enzyme
MIRQATPDDAPAVVPLLMSAMGHLAAIFAGTDDVDEIGSVFRLFFQMDLSQYSYANTLVFEEDHVIVGSITGYDGARLHELRQPVLDRLFLKEPDFELGDETGAGEYYVDCVSVDPAHQGRGIGKQLIKAFCGLAAAKGFAQVGLIVDQTNPSARKLYADLGFRIAGEKLFQGHRYDHMVFTV